jgi:hypothetical protein
MIILLGVYLMAEYLKQRLCRIDVWTLASGSVEGICKETVVTFRKTIQSFAWSH